MYFMFSPVYATQILCEVRIRINCLCCVALNDDHSNCCYLSTKYETRMQINLKI